MSHGENKFHDYHLVDPSPWPISTSFCLFLTVISFVLYLHDVFSYSIFLVGVCLASVAFCMIGWWADVLKEAYVDKAHTEVVKKGIRLGMIMLIFSEVMFFFAFFFSIFKSWLFPVHILNDYSIIGSLKWPPKGIKVIDPWSIPFLNTIILLLSGTTVTWAHYALLEKNYLVAKRALLSTIILGILFTSLQIFEYSSSPFPFKFTGPESVYSSNFFISTGFHGLHVIVGTIFLIVCYIRLSSGRIDNANHLGFELATIYWHFVDVVWLFLFTFVYLVSS